MVTATSIINPFTNLVNDIKQLDELHRKRYSEQNEKDKLSANQKTLEQFKKDFSKFYNVMIEGGITIESSKNNYMALELTYNTKTLTLFYYSFYSGNTNKYRWGNYHQCLAYIDTNIKDIVLLIHKSLFE